MKYVSIINKGSRLPQVHQYAPLAINVSISLTSLYIIFLPFALYMLMMFASFIAFAYLLKKRANWANRLELYDILLTMANILILAMLAISFAGVYKPAMPL